MASSIRRAWLGVNDSDILMAVLPRIPDGAVVFDIGAHAGYYTLALLSKAVHVHAFEPNPANLRFHVAVNHLESRVTIHEAAVSAQSGPGFLSWERESSVRHLASAGDPVRIVALDELELPIPAFIKMDVEGNEVSALRGMTNLLRRARPLILVACHGDLARSQTLELLAELSYTTSWVKPPDTLIAYPAEQTALLRPATGS